MKRIILVSAVLCLVAGCSDSGPPVGIVTGTVTLDGEPLPNAEVSFEPLFPEGSSSTSARRTDENGYYKMQYSIDRPGVLMGEHQVQISTAYDEKIPDPRDPSRTTLKKYRETVPVKYNWETELKYTVVKGKQEANFDLRSK